MLDICNRFESPIKERFYVQQDYDYSAGSSGTSSSFEGYSSDIIDNVLFSVTQNHKTLSEYTDVILANLENHEDTLSTFNEGLDFSKIQKYNRKMIVNWIIWICYNCQFNDETLFLAISIFDHYIFKTNDDSNACIAAICSLWISTKLNEVRIPTIESLVDICNNACTSNEILNFETVILNALKFNIIYPTYSHFSESLLSQIPVDDVFENYVSLFCHCALLSDEFFGDKPSHISLASIILAKIATDTKMSFNVVVRSLSAIDEKMLIKCISSISALSKSIFEKIDSAILMKFDSLLMININDIENIEKRIREMIPAKSSEFLDNI